MLKKIILPLFVSFFLIAAMLFISNCHRLEDDVLSSGTTIESIETPLQEYKSTSDNMSTESQESMGVTAAEAVLLAFDNIKDFISDPYFTMVNSTDFDDLPTIDSGQDGKRRVWYVSMADEYGNKQASCKVVDKKIEDVHSDDVSNYDWPIYFQKGKYRIQDLHIDSDEAVKIAIEEKGLKPGDPEIPENWLRGYHFTVVDAYSPDNPDETAFVIIVAGISPNGNIAKVTIAQETGEILGAGEQVGYDEDGHSIWEEF